MSLLNKCDFNHLRPDEINHIYKLEAVPSVSSIIDYLNQPNLGWIKHKISDYSNIAPNILKKAQERGNCFHSCLELFIKSGFKTLKFCLCEKQVESHRSNVMLFQTWYKKNVELVKSFERFESEKSLIANSEYCEYLFTGTTDLTFWKKGENTLYIIDFKTNSSKDIMKWTKQLHLYKWLIYEKYKNNLDTLFNLEIKMYVIWANAAKNKELQIIELNDDKIYNDEKYREKLMEVLIAEHQSWVSTWEFEHDIVIKEMEKIYEWNS